MTGVGTVVVQFYKRFSCGELFAYDAREFAWKDISSGAGTSEAPLGRTPSVAGQRSRSVCVGILASEREQRPLQSHRKSRYRGFECGRILPLCMCGDLPKETGERRRQLVATANQVSSTKKKELINSEAK